MNNSRNLIIHTDGGCRDNPGAGSWAFTGKFTDGTPLIDSGFLCRTTNNQAEYRGLEAACITVLNLDNNLPHSVAIYSDSQLIVNQINGRWGVSNDILRPYYLSAKAAYCALQERCPTTLTWVRREFNKEADALCNMEMDKRGVVCSRKGIRKKKT
jgi:ribonuclease HI